MAKKPTKIPVALPEFIKEAHYPPATAQLLRDLLDHRCKGITGPELHSLGHINVTGYINRLKKDGWIITTNRTTFTDSRGVIHKGVVSYKVIGCNVYFD